jgi:hypothetical protein
MMRPAVSAAPDDTKLGGQIAGPRPAREGLDYPPIERPRRLRERRKDGRGHS